MNFTPIHDEELNIQWNANLLKRSVDSGLTFKNSELIFVSSIVLMIVLPINFFLGNFEISPLSIGRWKSIFIMVSIFVMISLLADLIISIKIAKKFTNPLNRKVDVSALWRKVFTNPLNGIILVLILGFGITEIQSLVEYYRANVKVWYDHVLWGIESSIFSHLKGSFLDIPMLWEKIYFCFFAYKIAGFCILYRSRKRHDLGVMAVSFLLSFLITRIVAIQFPTQGPAFYRPDLFDMPGSLTEEGRKWLLLYMQGVGTQNGLTPGTMAMPSLHVGLTVTVAWFLFSNFRWTGWISAPWIILTWLSTIFLGWHYILDGFGGILVCVSSIMISDSAAKLFNSLKLSSKKMLNG